jgi:ABC-type Mn2+/Zn2+ transport system permease subunit
VTATTAALTDHLAPAPTQAAPAAQLAVQAPGVALCAIGVGFAAATLSLANAHILDPATGGFFTPVAFGIGAIALFCGGQWESGTSPPRY